MARLRAKLLYILSGKYRKIPNLFTVNSIRSKFVIFRYWSDFAVLRAGAEACIDGAFVSVPPSLPRFRIITLVLLAIIQPCLAKPLIALIIFTVPNPKAWMTVPRFCHIDILNLIKEMWNRLLHVVRFVPIVVVGGPFIRWGWGGLWNVIRPTGWAIRSWACSGQAHHHNQHCPPKGDGPLHPLICFSCLQVHRVERLSKMWRPQ